MSSGTTDLEIHCKNVYETNLAEMPEHEENFIPFHIPVKADNIDYDKQEASMASKQVEKS